MGKPKRKPYQSPAQVSAKKVREKYLTPSKKAKTVKSPGRAKRALYKNQSEVDDTVITIKNSVIKGYHDFKIRPPMNLPLPVDREYTNIHDVSACLVWLPDTVSDDQLNIETDSNRGLRLKDILGLPCGHVPRGLAPAFRQILDCGGRIEAKTTADPVPSFDPWPDVKEKGGGVVIPCDFVIFTKDNSHLSVLKQHISIMPEKDAMDVI